MDDRSRWSIIINVVVRPVVLIAVFISVFVLSSSLMNDTNQGITREMKECSFPTITASYKDIQLNRMVGYDDRLSVGGSHDCLSLLDSQNKLSIQIQTYGTEVASIRYEVRSMDMERLIEETVVSDFQTVDNTITVYLKIQDLLEEETDYHLIIQLATEENEDIYYYTRIRQDGAYNARECCDFIKDFHEKTINGKKDESIIKYLESGLQGDNSSFHHVDIQSSFDMVTWGDLEIAGKGTVDITLEEINNKTASFTLVYPLNLKNASGETEYYNVEEYYRVRYTKDRMYLLDYERTMNQYFVMENKVIYSTAVQLGIVGNEVNYRETPDGKTVVFTQAGELFSYDSSANSLTKIHGFWKTKGDVRYRNEQHGIEIINVDEHGNTDFIVYGYMVRGAHEGKVGISVCHYDSAMNTTEEYCFVETNRHYDVLKEDVKQLSYLNADGLFYVYLQNCLYEVNVKTRNVNVLAENVKGDEFKVSAEQSSLVLQKTLSLKDSTVLNYMDLEKNKTKDVTCGTEERIRPIGFVGDDFVYGIARAGDIYTDSDDSTVFPMYKIQIEDRSGKILKTYEPSNVYILDYSIENNVLNLVRGTKKENGKGYKLMEDEQLIHNEGDDKSGVQVASIVTETKKKEYQLDFGYTLPSGEKKHQRPKEVSQEKLNNIMPSEAEKQTAEYYVYAKGHMQGIYEDAAEAVKTADELAGVVITAKQEYIFERSKRQSKCQISGIETIGSKEGYNSMKACLSAILRYYGAGADAGTLVDQGMSPSWILQQELGEDRVVNLTGTEMDKVLYCVDRGYPVLAKSSSKGYVLIVGYNEWNTILMDPDENKTGYVGFNDSRKMFKEAGNVFIACLP